MKLGKFAMGAVVMTGLAVPAAAPAQIDNRLIETIAAVFLADKLGIDPMMITSLLGTNSGIGSGSLFDLAPVLLMQRNAPSADLSTLFGLRNQGMDWDTIATRVNMEPGRYSQLRSSGQLDNNNIWREIARDRMNVSNDNIQRLRQMGLTWRDVVMTSVISRESGRSLSEVANRYRSTRSWDRTARNYGVTSNEIQSRLNDWRRYRNVPTRWRTNTTSWTPPGLSKNRHVPPGLAKKGGVPPGQRKKRGHD